ncbi:MAG TPA: glycosyltransferase family 4 protein [Pirellulales bacterium]|jgi:glycosyltransferase involved in cell wall biosynthesis|nr:glycosyltransferase family 4 protein [Pirellulales bacterium]
MPEVLDRRRIGSPSTTARIACVQGGDFWTTKCRLDIDGQEFYGGQRYSIDAYERFVAGHLYLVVSLDAPVYAEQRGSASYCGVPNPLPTSLVPRRVSEWLRARQVIRHLEAFGATHLIVRCNDLVGCELLRWAMRRNVQVAAIQASRFAGNHRYSRLFCQLGNAPNVRLMANHNRAATASMVECGLAAEKAIAWDFPPAITPDRWSPRQLDTTATPTIVFAGRVCHEKGVGDLVAGCAMCREQGHPVKLVICGDGPLLPELRRHPGVGEGWLELAGLLQNTQIHERMRSGTLTAVPSRHDFAEGLPLVIYESLAARTPVLLSDHPIFVRYFHDDQAIRFFRGSDPASLAQQIIRLLGDAPAYARLSHETEAVWNTLHCPTTFGDVLDRLRHEWNLDTPTADED